MSFSDKFLRINLRQEINYSLINKSPVIHGSLKATKKHFLIFLLLVFSRVNWEDTEKHPLSSMGAVYKKCIVVQTIKSIKEKI